MTVADPPRWLVQVIALPEETLLSEQPFTTKAAALDFVGNVMVEWECECLVVDRTGEVRSQRFAREPMVGRYDNWD